MSVWSFCPTQINTVLSNVTLRNKGNQDDLILYHSNWTRWIHKFSGCEKKSQWAVSNGIHDALINQLAYKRHIFKKFYAFNTDYKFYPVLLSPYNHMIISPEEISKIEPSSYVIVSQPNHEGGMTKWFSHLIEHCRSTNSKIFLDCAFYGTTSDTLDTSDSVYDAVAFSLSKNFLLGGLRAGIVFGDKLSPALTIPISHYYSYNYFNVAAVQSANAILPLFHHTYLTEFAKPRQLEYCRNNKLTPADIWMWAFDIEGNKICITEKIKYQIQKDIDGAPSGIRTHTSCVTAFSTLPVSQFPAPGQNLAGHDGIEPPSQSS